MITIKISGAGKGEVDELAAKVNSGCNNTEYDGH